MPHDLQKFPTTKRGVRFAFCVFAQGPTRWRAISAGRYRTSNTPTMKTRTLFFSGQKTVLFPPAFNTPKDYFTKTGSGNSEKTQPKGTVSLFRSKRGGYVALFHANTWTDSRGSHIPVAIGAGAKCYTVFFERSFLIVKMIIFYQDRLRTNIGRV